MLKKVQARAPSVVRAETVHTVNGPNRGTVMKHALTAKPSNKTSTTAFQTSASFGLLSGSQIGVLVKKSSLTYPRLAPSVMALEDGVSSIYGIRLTNKKSRTDLKHMHALLS